MQTTHIMNTLEKHLMLVLFFASLLVVLNIVLVTSGTADVYYLKFEHAVITIYENLRDYL